MLPAPPARQKSLLAQHTTPEAPAAAPGPHTPLSTRGAAHGCKLRWSSTALVAAAGGAGSATPHLGVHARGEGPRCASGRRPAVSHQAPHVMNRRRQALRHAARRLGRSIGCSWLSQGLPTESAVVAVPHAGGPCGSPMLACAPPPARRTPLAARTDSQRNAGTPQLQGSGGKRRTPLVPAALTARRPSVA